MELKPLIDDLVTRADKIRMPAGLLAKRAGVNETTVRRVLERDVDPRFSTLDKIDRALTDEEQRLLAYLHSLPSSDVEAAE